jgi:hypothetical protein
LCRLQDVLVGAFGAPGVEAELADTVRAVPVTLDPGR